MPPGKMIGAENFVGFGIFDATFDPRLVSLVSRVRLPVGPDTITRVVVISQTLKGPMSSPGAAIIAFPPCMVKMAYLPEPVTTMPDSLGG